MKPKVLFILHLPPPIYGATIANEYIQNSGIIQKGFESCFINLATNTDLKDAGKATIRKPFLFLSILSKVIRILARGKFDICLVSLTASGPAFYKDLIVTTLLKIFRVRTLYFFHNKGVASASRNRLNDFLYRYVFHKTKSILLSRNLYPDIEKYVREEDVFYCPYGIPVIETMDVREKPFDEATPCRLLFLGNMMKEKGVFILLDACKRLKDLNYSFTCHFVGGWTDISIDEFNNYVHDSGLSDIVFVHGPKYDSEKFWFYSNSDIFVFPTFYHYETFGLVNLEAMQFGLPIITTPEGGISEAVSNGDTGFLVPQRDLNELIAKLELLIGNPVLRRKMGIKGQKRFHDLFTLDKFEEKIAQILMDAASSDW